MKRYRFEPDKFGGVIEVPDEHGEHSRYSDAIAEIDKWYKAVVEQGMQIEEVYKVLEGEKVSDFAMSFGLISKAADKMAEIAAKDKEITELMAILEMYEETQSTLIRLTAALNDDEKAERVADKKGCTLLGRVHRGEGITDYRADILKELQQQHQDSGNYRTDPKGTSMSSKS